MWEISSLQQWISFFESITLGVALGLVYSILSLDRKIFKRKNITVFFIDIIFFIIAAFLTFIFMLMHTNGAVRFYVFFGEWLGCFVFIKATSPILKKVAKFLKKMFTKLNICYRKTILKCNNFFTFKKNSSKNTKRIKKSEENL